MISILIDILLILLLLLIGIVPAFKKLIKIITKYICKLFHITTKRAFQDSHSIRVSKEFKEVVGVKHVKESKTNIKKKTSIHFGALGILVVSIILFVINLESLTGQVVTHHLLPLLDGIPFIKTVYDVNTYFTAIILTLASFSLSMLYKRGIETKGNRKEKKLERAKRLYLSNASTKELVDEANKKEENVKNKIVRK